MKEMTVISAGSDTIYVPAPCRSTLAAMRAVYQAGSVATATIKASLDSDIVNQITAVTDAGLVVENGKPDDTNKGLVFDPDSTEGTEQVVKIINNNAAKAIITLVFDDSAYVEQKAKEA